MFADIKTSHISGKTQPTSVLSLQNKIATLQKINQDLQNKYNSMQNSLIDIANDYENAKELFTQYGIILNNKKIY
jgi:hypothetical protein